ncbi:hypothetical protein SAMN05421823_104434 [Catalinimonas alkaloidigena]|uniref:Uncharacterized protein n=1 Tax=Catalinimonas alkaloidigena TaxID=1075417 RepID=A0A1G9HI69_9BACT|nr:hypothetical protein [Catalinimonas alkaloidigena]SDL12213.1 hypothetical protein SAMN05421823_104434 [Catalinimonas alkaloidigena]
MRKLILLLCGMLNFAVFAQAPHSFNYQAVLRDAAGTLLTDRSVTMRLSIVRGTADGQAVYAETHATQTNAYGLITLKVGEGETNLGDFSSIDWQTNDFFLKVELDENGGVAYRQLGTSQLLSVPFALYADRAGNVVDYEGGEGIGIAGNVVSNLAPSPWVPINTGISYNKKIGIGYTTSTFRGRVHINSKDSIGGELPLWINGTTTGLTFGSNTHGRLLRLQQNADDNRVFDLGIDRNQAFFIQNHMNGYHPEFTISAGGNVGIATAQPKSRLQVTDGDVYVDNSSRGMILKSPNGQCWRVTLDNNGEFVKTPITCP